MSNLPTFTQGLSLSITQFVNADGTTAKIIQPTTTNGIRIIGINISNTDVDQEFELLVNDGSSDFLLWVGDIPFASGASDGRAIYSILKQLSFTAKEIDANGNPYIDLPSTHSLKIAMKSAITSPELINVFVSGELF